MADHQVLEWLGPPEEERNADSDEEVVRWCYGVGKESGFPTLGQVWLRQTANTGKPSKTVVAVWGGYGSPPSDKTLSETRLRRMLDVLGTVDFAKVGGVDRSSFDPLAYIRATNTLLPEGKASIIAAISEYFRVYTGRPENILLLTGILFALPPGQSSFQHSSRNPGYLPDSSDDVRIPDFLLLKDVPLLMSDYARREGIQHDSHLEEYIRGLRLYGRLRSQPLRPTDQPLELFDSLTAFNQEATERTLSVNNDAGKQAIMHQLLRLLRSVNSQVRLYCRTPEQANVRITPEQWHQFKVEEARRKIRWNPTIGDYALQ